MIFSSNLGIMKDMDLPKSYIPKEYEDKIYQKWESSGFFNPDKLKTAKDAASFAISMPPPNATGVLHVGHTLGIALQDIMTRYHRMKGDKTLLLPGTDHAAIATQNVVEKLLRKEGSSRHKLGRKKFLQKTNQYVEKNKATINRQTRKMGASADWSREAYTMSDELNRVVAMQFKKMHNDGLIYRGDRIVSWCPRCHSTLADDEVEYKEQKGNLWTFKYSKEFPISIATTRPETKLGDTGVAVHPDDKRYREYIGKSFEVNFVGVKLKIKIIGDREVNPEFGTGAVGVTPAHSMVDWQMASENDLEIKKVINEDGKILEGFGEYSGLKSKEARDKIVERLKKAGLIEGQEEIENNISLCYRCGAEIEPLPSLQWFIAVDKEFKLINPQLIKSYGQDKATLKGISLWAVKSGAIKIVPEYFDKTYFHWMENLRDWCISRQIWFGHRIPVWYRGGEIYVGAEPPQGKDWRQDEDTLDTWFSSALWTWSTLLEKKGYKKHETLEEWLKASADIQNFHPTSVMETMHDILFFWVARMIIMTLYALNEVPFKTVYLHGMIADKHGKKMSKSNPETIIEPVAVAEKYGTDALRLSMVVGNSAGNKLNLSEQKIAGYRNFANKLWNIGRFIQMNLKSEMRGKAAPRTLADKWIVSRLNSLIKEVSEDLDRFKFGLAGEKLYSFTWRELADWYVEIAKVQNDDNSHKLLVEVYKELLKLLHPFTPFVTEKIWEYIGGDKLLMVEKWPEVDDKKINSQVEQDFVLIKELITVIRSWRKENKREPKEIIKIQIAGADKLIGEQKEIINKLARVETESVKELADKDFEVENLRVRAG